MQNFGLTDHSEQAAQACQEQLDTSHVFGEQCCLIRFLVSPPFI